MNRFSDRIGVTYPRSTVQVESLDEKTRNRLWNVVYEVLFRDVSTSRYAYMPPRYKDLFSWIWRDFFHVPIDQLEFMDRGAPYNFVRKYFFESEWYKVYNFIEALVQRYPDGNLSKRINEILEQEVCDYYIVYSYLTKVTDPAEIREIESALLLPYEPVNQHLKQSLDSLSKKPKPNSIRSIRESISAVEVMCRLVTGDTDATVGTTATLLRTQGLDLDRGMEEGLSKLYRWTKENGIIRHVLMEKTSVDFDDAKYFLVICSAFVNYLKKMADKLSIDIDGNYKALGLSKKEQD